ncbi:MAG TPA: methyltransferase domain-containing protein [Acidimicrobiia bacterium]|nr:methyltransferase domain-containing protein [Acidimicrobiia bacterium]
MRVGTEPSPDDRVLLVCHIRAARGRARALAVAEVMALLRDTEPAPETGGPLAGERGIAWVSLAARRLGDVEPRLRRLGYVEAVDVTEPATANDRDVVRWRRRRWRLRRMHTDDPDRLREQSPDRREFVLRTETGTRPVRGYRGSGGTFERRALPVVDARLLVNLAAPADRSGRLLDPFGGAGGIAVAAHDAGHVVFSGDRDTAVAAGLAVLTESRHVVADAARLPHATAAFDAIATETPFEPAADDTIARLLPELARVLAPGGRLAVMCAPRQAEIMNAGDTPLDVLVDEPVDRKGVPTRVLAWQRRSDAVVDA